MFVTVYQIENCWHLRAAIVDNTPHTNVYIHAYIRDVDS